MNKLNYIVAGAIALGGLGFVSTKVMADKSSSATDIKPSTQKSIASDPFANDPFFQSGSDIFEQMNKMQHAMNALMQSHFNQMHNNLNKNYTNQGLNNGPYRNIDIKEDKSGLIYKIKLPKGADNNVDISVKNGQLIISSNITQKITREEDNSKSVSYSRSSNTQSFPLPKGYDGKSMTTKMKGSNLIVTFQRIKS